MRVVAMEVGVRCPLRLRHPPSSQGQQVQIERLRPRAAAPRSIHSEKIGSDRKAPRKCPKKVLLGGNRNARGRRRRRRVPLGQRAGSFFALAVSSRRRVHAERVALAALLQGVGDIGERRICGPLNAHRQGRRRDQHARPIWPRAEDLDRSSFSPARISIGALQHQMHRRPAQHRPSAIPGAARPSAASQSDIRHETALSKVNPGFGALYMGNGWDLAAPGNISTSLNHAGQRPRLQSRCPILPFERARARCACHPRLWKRLGPWRTQPRSVAEAVSRCRGIRCS